ncbi:U3 small nucleolar ribonucleoprotein IMP3 [Cryptococcus gattii Ru294]|uniref:U3 small nucleolar ribonucleoprotein protein IMP3 n=2 Tax=Cryptococcus gattii TaxID=37769 RepID=E6R560_CRYGW|nr:u3 small nucleolar ribonucleoprotein imp3, putative [Cryptococcus gattii WM276]KIR56853.1 U3 small nucleolar ribonucleoprotein IMP3 [Cryptococcus gattii Ru294]KIR80347.1 U3 small nucleolar ribonucleoprotein IMP3 [Cryptococcus gattii EJB2]KIY33666.1 U3 small nucleolar ribonucleoprotein IMP3 [Cryptococcus gattii E566]KJE00314.1 U3 small nucleolar ribonucleoprotein IMP3 [Cryptococcus gattii NT-10]ADV22182.1 u3 small nucleolar ribonucleoprotein protein imp3, putative [Cryptococcus gattii WM276]
MRQLKHHEKKLLKKVDFLSWKQDASQREVKVMRKYHIQDREDYHKYNKLCGSLRSLIHKLSLLPANDPFRQQKEAEMLDKLYDMGILDIGSKPSDIENKVTVSSIARRRLAVVVARLKMSETVSDAVRTIEQGHIRVGPTPVTDPAMLVTRRMEDFVTWVDTSARKRTIMKYNDEVSFIFEPYSSLCLCCLPGK